MKFSRQLSLILVLFFFLLWGLCFGAEKPAPTPVSPNPVAQNPVSSTTVLPAEFAGWQLKGAISKSDDPAAADETNAPVLKEYGFLRLEKAAYTRDDGRNLTIKAAVFEDASGAYGAFTYYFSPEMGAETIGAQAAFLNNRLLFYQGNVLVDAVFDKMSVMSAGQLRQLAGLLPQLGGNKGNPPSLPSRLPQRAGETSVEKNTIKYILGPAALDRVGSPLPDAMVDFKSGAEVVISKYAASAGDATLMLIEYPTSQIAAEQLRQILASHKITPPPPGVTSIVDVGPFFDTRTGPIIVIASGPLSKSEARSLLSSVSYDADVTWNENTYLTKKDNLASLLFNVIVLCGIVGGLAVVAGIAFGGIRVLVKRLFPDSVFNRREAAEFISLRLEDEARPAPRKR
ncbi:MAG TPA: DUF6599 family protein [Terriglobales bacterium]|jgi:uncharacterized protein DUF6599|nr:DUF6599 family protein [Terriglobales bacterium]